MDKGVEVISDTARSVELFQMQHVWTWEKKEIFFNRNNNKKTFLRTIDCSHICLTHREPGHFGSFCFSIVQVSTVDKDME